jgi:hypothetical protein
MILGFVIGAMTTGGNTGCSSDLVVVHLCQWQPLIVRVAMASRAHIGGRWMCGGFIGASVTAPG